MVDLDDSPLLHEPDLMLAVLRVGADRSGTLHDCIEHLRLLRRAAQIEEPMPEGDVREALETVLAKLHRAALIETPAPGRFRTTARGRAVLAANPDGVDDTVLAQLPEFRPANGHHARAAMQTVAAQTLNAAYQSGFEAALAGASLADNPLPRDVRAYLDWENGWSLARDELLRRESPPQPGRRRRGAAGAGRGSG